MPPISLSYVLSPFYQTWQYFTFKLCQIERKREYSFKNVLINYINHYSAIKNRQQADDLIIALLGRQVCVCRVAVCADYDINDSCRSLSLFLYRCYACLQCDCFALFFFMLHYLLYNPSVFVINIIINIIIIININKIII